MPLKHRKLFPGGQVVVGLRSSPAAGGDHGRPAAGTAIGRRGGSEGLQTRRPSRAPPWRRDPRWTRRSVTAVAWAAPTPNPPVVAHLSTRRHERPVLGRGRAASGALRSNENGHTSWTPREPPMPRTRRSRLSRFSRARTARCRAPGAAGASLFFWSRAPRRLERLGGGRWAWHQRPALAHALGGGVRGPRPARRCGEALATPRRGRRGRYTDAPQGALAGPVATRCLPKGSHPLRSRQLLPILQGQPPNDAVFRADWLRCGRETYGGAGAVGGLLGCGWTDTYSAP